MRTRTEGKVDIVNVYPLSCFDPVFHQLVMLGADQGAEIGAYVYVGWEIRRVEEHCRCQTI